MFFLWSFPQTTWDVFLRKRTKWKKFWYQDNFSFITKNEMAKCLRLLQLSINACCSRQKLVKNAQKISGYSEHVADKCHVTLSFSHCKCQSILTFSFSRHANVKSRDLTKENYLTLRARSIWIKMRSVKKTTTAWKDTLYRFITTAVFEILELLAYTVFYTTTAAQSTYAE